MEVCVTGATGFVGGRLVPALLDRGHDVTALVRDRDRYDPPAGVDVVEGDLLEPGSFDEAVDVEAAYYLVHSMASGEDFEERDRRAARNFRRAADRAGLDRAIYLGGLGGEDARLSEHLRSRREVERLLGDGEYDLTVLRAAIVVGAGSASFRIVAQLADRLPLMVTPRWVRTECQPIAVDDVIAYLAGVLDAPATAGEVYEVGGPEVLTYQSMMETTARLLGRRMAIVPVPILSPGLSAYWIDLVTDVPRSVAHPLVDGLSTPVVVEDDRIDDRVAVEKTDFETAARAALSEMGYRVRGADRDRDADPAGGRRRRGADGAAAEGDG